MQSPELPIAIVSRETGIAKEVLRKWESRYGFPEPQRDASGNRLYAYVSGHTTRVGETPENLRQLTGRRRTA